MCLNKKNTEAWLSRRNAHKGISKRLRKPAEAVYSLALQQIDDHQKKREWKAIACGDHVVITQ
jgi:hypothetical protein